MDKTSTNVVEKRAYADQIDGWLQFAKEQGSRAIAVVKDLREGGFVSFIMTELDTKESMEKEFDDDRYFKVIEIIPVPEEPSQLEELRAS